MNKRFIEFVVAGLMVFVTLVVLQRATDAKLSDPDGYYHARASQLLEAGQLKAEFPWLQFTTWKEGYANQHYIYHTLLAPFNTVERLPLSVIAFGCLFFASAYWLLNRFHVRWKLFWIVLLLSGSADFLFRINLIKANTLSLALLLCITGLIYLYNQSLPLPKRWWYLLGMTAISAVFVGTYGGFVTAPLVAGAYVFARLVTERKFNVWPLVFIGAGIAAGFVLHPHQHNMVSLLYDQLFKTGLGAGSEVPAGNEWLPYDVYWFVKSDAALLGVWALSLIVTVYAVWKQRTARWEHIWVQVIAVGMLVLALWHRRFIEYWVPFGVLASAVTLTPYLARIAWGQVLTLLKAHYQLVVACGIVISLVGVSLGYNARYVYRSLQAGDSVYGFKDAAEWMAAHSSPGDVVLNTQWDQFPALFYWNAKNYYIVGLDPTFMYIHNPDLYWQWRKVADDNVEDWESVQALHSIIKDGFGARYLFIEPGRNEDIGVFIESNNEGKRYFQKVFEDGKTLVFELK